MKRKRIWIAVALVLGVVVIVLGVDAWQRSQAEGLLPGAVPVYLNGRLVASFVPADLERLEKVSFTDAEEGKTQDGWLLVDILSLYLEGSQLQPEATILVSSSSREKSVRLTWEEVRTRENMVMFDLSGRSTLKLVSKLEQLDTRDDWVQDVDKIEIGVR
ncbi:MAG TPA: hypothetical protein VM366_05115 [Anaerolineae bacterium]|nr:hypothetical protein [Anaerolineae bacterium]